MILLSAACKSLLLLLIELLAVFCRYWIVCLCLYHQEGSTRYKVPREDGGLLDISRASQVKKGNTGVPMIRMSW